MKEKNGTWRRPGAPGVALTLLAVGIPGCIEADPSIEAGGAGTPMELRTLDAPPDPQVGEWWTVELRSVLTDTDYETTIVVTGRAEGNASIGMPASELDHDFLLLHLPPLGDLDLETFAWRVMWDDFEALRFPLESGRAWTADFHGFDVEAEVTHVENGKARVTMVGDGERIELTYDAAMGMITEFQEEALGLSFRVTDHGFDYEGLVSTPGGIQLALMDARPSAAMGGDTEAGGPHSVIEVEGSRSHGSIGLVLAIGSDEAARGTYGVAVTAPDGTTFEETFTPSPGDPPLAVRTFGHDAVTGNWDLEFERDGTGVLAVEIFTYDLVEARLGRQ